MTLMAIPWEKIIQDWGAKKEAIFLWLSGPSKRRNGQI